jgi:hypothetical protein
LKRKVRVKSGVVFVVPILLHSTGVYCKRRGKLPTNLSAFSRWFFFSFFFAGRFGGRRHQLWLEPEGLTSDLVYPQGLSCTMPEEYQVQLVRSIPGLEDAEVVRPGGISLSAWTVAKTARKY